MKGIMKHKLSDKLIHMDRLIENNALLLHHS